MRKGEGMSPVEDGGVGGVLVAQKWGGPVLQENGMKVRGEARTSKAQDQVAKRKVT